MNPILLTLIIIYLVIVLTKNVFSNKEIASDMPPIIANIMLFIRKNLDDIFLTIFTMLGLIIYFTVAGVNLNANSHHKIEDEIIVERFDNMVKQRMSEYKKHTLNAMKKEPGSIEEKEEHCNTFSKHKDICLQQPYCGWCNDNSDINKKCTLTHDVLGKSGMHVQTINVNESNCKTVEMGPINHACKAGINGSPCKGNCFSSHMGIGGRNKVTCNNP